MAGGRRLVKFEELPGHLQFNPYVTTGYRPPLDAKGCLDSLCYWHNESLNIYSHFIGLLYFILSVYQYSYIWPTNGWTVVSTFICTDYITVCLPYGLSVMYHTFMCHSNGAQFYRKILKIDVIGIWIFSTFAEIQIIFVTLYYYPFWRITGILSYLLLSSLVFYFLTKFHDKLTRMLIFTSQCLFRIMILFIKITPYGCGPSNTTIFYIVFEGMCGTAALVNALHFPEKYLPPAAGSNLTGHTIMHVMGLIATVIGRYGFLGDMKWLNSL